MSLITKIEFINKFDSNQILNTSNYDMHDLLTDNADWDDEYWDFYPDKLLQYSKTLEEIIISSSKGIVFQSLWVGEEPTNTIELSIPEFINIIVTNKIKTKARYIVSKSA